MHAERSPRRRRQRLVGTRSVLRFAEHDEGCVANRLDQLAYRLWRLPGDALEIEDDGVEVPRGRCNRVLELGTTCTSNSPEALSLDPPGGRGWVCPLR